MLIRNLDMKKVTDGVQFVLQKPITIQETFSFQDLTSAHKLDISNAKKTVLVLDCDETKFKEVFDKKSPAIKVERKAIEDAKKEISETKVLIKKNVEEMRTVEAKDRKPFLEKNKELKARLADQEKKLAELTKHN
jgi:hypothetical protein